ncbi:MAG: 50S ribosomal protein L18e [Candidatus Nanohalarchaeota archaeon]|nr:MAG: 50S ribosomal protein L18e [Candidatus Nanohaloarchaeota archaeon]
MKLRNFTDNSKKELILALKKQHVKDKKQLWLDLAKRLNKASRNMPAVNLKKIEQNTKENDIVIVAGKILSDGELSKKITLCSFNASESALDKIKEANCKYIGFDELMKLKKLNNVKIMA